MKIYIPRNVKSELPLIIQKQQNIGYVKAGIHEAMFNPQGAVSVKSTTGVDFGIKLDEFLFLSKEDREEWIKMAYPQIPNVKLGEENDYVKLIWKLYSDFLDYCLDCHDHHETEDDIIDCFLDGIREKLPKLKNNGDDGWELTEEPRE